MEPVDVQFRINNGELAQQSQSAVDSILGISRASDDARKALRTQINEQKAVVRQIESDLKSLNRISVDEQRAVVRQVESDIKSLKKSIKEAPTMDIASGFKKDLKEARKVLEFEQAQLKELRQGHTGNISATAVPPELIGDIKEAGKALEYEKERLREVEQKLNDVDGASRRLGQAKMKLRDDMLRLKMEGREESAEFEQLKQKLEVTEAASRELNKEIRLLSSRDAQFQGLINGLSGVAGVLSAGAGAVALFGGENENLEKIQTRLQALMAITIGLQQTYNTLQETSAFRTATVTAVKKAWTAAQTALNTQLGISVGLSKALMISGVGALLVGIAALVALYDKWKKKQEEAARSAEEAAKKQQEFNTAVSEGYAKQVGEIKATRAALDGENISRKEKQRIINELKRTIPGYTAELSKEGAVIRENKKAIDDYLVSLARQSKFRAAANELEKIAARQMKFDLDTEKELGKNYKDYVLFRELASNSQRTPWDESRLEAIKSLHPDFQSYRWEEERLKREEQVFLDYIKKNNLTELALKTTGKTPGTTDLSAREKAAQAAREKLAQAAVDSENRTNALVISAMEKGAFRRIEEVNNNYDREIDAIDKKLKEIAALELSGRSGGKFTEADQANADKARADLEGAKQAALKVKNSEIQQIELESAAIINQVWDDVNTHFRTGLENNLANIDRYYDDQVAAAVSASTAVTEVERQAIADRLNLYREAEKESARREDALNRNDFNAGLAVSRHDLSTSGTGMTELAERQRTEILLRYARERLEIIKNETGERAKMEQAQLKTTIAGYNKSLGSRKSVKEMLDTRAFNKVYDGFFKSGKSAEQATEETNAFFEKFRTGGAIAVEALGAIREVTGETSRELSVALDAAMNIAQGFASGGLTGGIVAAAGSLVNVTAALLTAKSEVDESVIESYRVYIDLLDEVIDKQIQSLKTLGGQAFTNAINKTLADFNKKINETRSLLKKTLNSGAGVFSHSVAYEINLLLRRTKDIFVIRKETGEAIYGQVATELQRLGLFGKAIQDFTTDELISLREIPALYSELPASVREYIDSLAEAREAQAELNREIQDMILGFDYSDVTTAIVDAFTDPEIEDSISSLGRSVDQMIAGMVKNIIVKFALIEPVTRAVNDLMRGIATYDEYGNITGFKDVKDIDGGVLSAFKDAVLGLGAGLGKTWEELSAYLSGYGIDITGKTGEGSDAGENSLKGAYAKASQESIDLLAGQTAGTRIAVESLLAFAQQRAEQTRTIAERMAGYRDAGARIAEDVRAIRGMVSDILSASTAHFSGMAPLGEAVRAVANNSATTAAVISGTAAGNRIRVQIETP